MPSNLWVNGVGPGDLLLARARIFESLNEDEQRKVEVLVCTDCKQKGMAMLNPKNIDG